MEVFSIRWHMSEKFVADDDMDGEQEFRGQRTSTSYSL